MHKAGRITYDVPTPSAMVGVLEAIYWHPGVHYAVQEIHVLNPIKKQSMTFNELGYPQISVKKSKGRLKVSPIDIQKHRTQRKTTLLSDVHYIVVADLFVNAEESEDAQKRGVEAATKKAWGIFQRRLEKHQPYHMPYLGMREYEAKVRPVTTDKKPIRRSMDLGIMLHHIEFLENGLNLPVFFRARLKNGVLRTDTSKIITYQEATHA